MRKSIMVLLLIALLGGVGVYVYSRGWRPPGWISSMFSGSGDSATTSKVKSALGLSKRISGFDIGVSTADGAVTLTGQVSSEDVKSLAGEIARDTQGVKEVRNEIQVDPTAQPSTEATRVEDLEIRTAILESFARSPELAGKNIDIKVERRIVTLSGSVETPAQRNGAEQTARAVDGVAGMTNNLTVTNPQAASEPAAGSAAPADANADLAKRVKFELFDTGAFDTSTINIKADDGTVTISGTVRTRAEQLLAERVAQGVPGVKKVVNDLKVAAAPARR